jgi:hypothetical protein
MFTSLRRFSALAAAALLVMGVLAAAPARAVGPNYAISRQGRYRPTPYWPYASRYGLVNPNYQVAPGLSINQYAYNVSVLGRAYSRVPPYALGYNPYVTANYYGLYNPYAYSYYYNPYASYLYPYAASSYYNPYLYGSGYYNPYYGYTVSPYLY